MNDRTQDAVTIVKQVLSGELWGKKPSFGLEAAARPTAVCSATIRRASNSGLSRRPTTRTGLSCTGVKLGFTLDARRAIRAAAESAALLEHREVDPFHLLIGCLQVPDGFAARVLGPTWQDGELGAIGEVIDMACRYGPHPFHQATGVFSPAARGVVAEGSLSVAYRLGHLQISTGHLALAVLDSQDRTGFRRILPTGWTISGSARSDIHLRVPDSRSESDFQIRPGWIIAELGPAPERLASGALDARTPPGGGDRGHRATVASHWQGSSTPFAELIDDRHNPTLRLGYGDPRSPVAAPIEHDLHLNMLISTS